GCSRPSMVVMRFPSHSPTGVTQERVALPSMTTVHAPQRPSPQPYLLPVRSKSSRRTLSRLCAGSTLSRCLLPLTCNSAILSIGASTIGRAWCYGCEPRRRMAVSENGDSSPTLPASSFDPPCDLNGRGGKLCKRRYRSDAGQRRLSRRCSQDLS